MGDLGATVLSVRIAYVGNFRPAWSTENHLASTLRRLGHDVVPLQEDEHAWGAIEEQAREADLLWYTRTWGIDDPRAGMATLRRLELLGVPSVSYHLDLYVGLAREATMEGDPFWHTTRVFTADGGVDDAVWRAKGIEHRWMPAGVFADECYLAEPPTRHRLPVTFVGSERYHPEWPYRTELLAWLRRHYGTGFRRYPVRRDRAIRGEELNRLYASCDVVVGDSLCLGFTHERYWSDRIYETLGRGGFLVHPRIAGLEEHFIDEEHVVLYEFGDFVSLDRIIRYYLHHPEERERIRLSGHAHVKKHHTYDHRLRAVLALLVREGVTG